MPDQAGENESVAPADSGAHPNTTFHTFVWFVRIAACAYLIGIVWTVWQEDEAKLYILHSWIKMLQGMARVLGTWALEAEAAYNEVASLLH